MEIKLDGTNVTQEQLNEAIKNTDKTKKIVEVAPGEWKTLTKLKEEN